MAIPATSSNFIKLASLLVLLIISCVHSASSIGDSDFGFGVQDLLVAAATTTSSTSACQGTIGECVDADDEEFLVDSESTRRILRGRRYISYGALRRNYVPCSRRGASYYNCRPGASANPYRRGCNRIARCRR